MSTAREATPRDKLLIVGTGAESTRATIERTRTAAEVGADAALMITPCYYKGQMTAEALRRHYFTLADASPIPILLYNVPIFTGLDLSAETVLELAQHPNIAGIKDGGGNVPSWEPSSEQPRTTLRCRLVQGAFSTPPWFWGRWVECWPWPTWPPTNAARSAGLRMRANTAKRRSCNCG